MATESLMMKQSDKETDAYATAGGGGALKLKGVEMKRKKKKSKKHKREREEKGDDEGAARADSMATKLANRAVAEESEEETDPSESMTAAEKRYHKVLEARASEAAAKAVEITHRMKVEKFNEGLSNLSEHNDIPRVSAAGNG